MNEIITFSCPSCGGHLQREAYATTYTCAYCGQKHRVANEEIEEFGRCPICHKNDKVEKVRVINYRGDNLASRLAPPQDPQRTLEYRPDPKPTQAEKPLPKRIRSKSITQAYIIIASATVVSLSACCGSAFIFQDQEKLSTALTVLIILALLAFLVALVFLLKGKVEESSLNNQNELLSIKAWNKQTQENESVWSANLEQYNKEYQHKKAALADEYQKAMQRYEQLYYCHCDDCIFIPGESGHAPSAKLEGFLYTE